MTRKVDDERKSPPQSPLQAHQVVRNIGIILIFFGAGMGLASCG
jgi:hypothetical protein